MSIIGFVPARAGSKAIPSKNIKTFCGKPLIYWVLKALQDAPSIDRVVLATDCHKISEVSKRFNFSKLEIFPRSEESAQDDSPTEDVIKEFLNNSALDDDDFFVLCQATTPFTTSDDIERSVNLLISKKYDSLLSCTNFKRFLWNEKGKSINYDYQKRPRRQEFNGLLLENGAIYINKVKHIKQRGNRLSGNILTYEMPEYTSLELDEEDHWLIGESLMRKYQPENILN